MNPMRDALERYENNRRQLECALLKAGGAAHVILNKNSYTDVLCDLAANGINLTAEYVGEKK